MKENCTVLIVDFLFFVPADSCKGEPSSQREASIDGEEEPGEKGSPKEKGAQQLQALLQIEQEHGGGDDQEGAGV